MDEMAREPHLSCCGVTSEAAGCAAANLHRHGGITAAAMTLNKESRKERRFMAHEFWKDQASTLVYSNSVRE
jgi:quinol monooxygenase YgiN